MYKINRGKEWNDVRIEEIGIDSGYRQNVRVRADLNIPAARRTPTQHCAVARLCDLQERKDGHAGHTGKDDVRGAQGRAGVLGDGAGGGRGLGGARGGERGGGRAGCGGVVAGCGVGADGRGDRLQALEGDGLGDGVGRGRGDGGESVGGGEEGEEEGGCYGWEVHFGDGLRRSWGISTVMVGRLN